MFLRRLRSLVFWTHLVIGISAGAIILLMSVTGVLLGFERQMIPWLDGAPTVTTPPDASSAFAESDLDAALAAARIEPASIASILLRRDPTIPVTVRFHERGRAAALLDPFSGKILAPHRPGRGQAFFSGLRRWHRWMGASDGPLRTRMRELTGAANLAFLALLLSGLWLWWPRRWTPSRMRATLVPSLRHSGKARDFNWHNSLGFWCAIPLALVVTSGVFISYQWPGRWLDRMAGSPSERAAARAPRQAAAAAAAAAGPADGAQREKHLAVSAPVSIEPFLSAARAAHPDWQLLTLTIAADASAPVRLVVAEGNTLRPDLRTTLVLDRATAAIVERSGYADLSTSRRIRSWVRFGHTGEVFGLAGQLVATLVSAAGALLVWTGFALAWSRSVAWRRRRGARLRLPTAGNEPVAG